MKLLKGYSIKSTLFKSKSVEIFRAEREHDKLPVIIKTNTNQILDDRESSKLRHEFEVGVLLEGNGTINYLELIQENDELFIIAEDFGGSPILDFFKAKNFEVRLFFDLSLKIVAALEEIHSKNIIHKDLNPSNILYNPDSGLVKIIDFEISSVFDRENKDSETINLIEGTLTYISPEQTGRMNRSLDYRSDFYSLGITFYEMLCGSTPFTFSDKLQIIHAHIAIPPKPLHRVNSKVPEPLSNLIMKLLSKTVEDRYQSTRGIIHDLEVCQKPFLNSGSIPLFELGQQDFSGKFHIHEKLYGREKEITTLTETFNRVCLGHREILLVSGYSGVGKTVLVKEIHKPVIARKGYFIQGKFDQYHRNIPYSAMIKAYRQLIQQLLTESDVRIEMWREKFLLAFGPNGQLIIDVIPEIALIIGPQPEPPDLRGEAEKNRFTLLFRNFIKSLASAEHPLVVFLDDLQWADLATINLIQDMMQVAAIDESKYLYLIGAYRENEVDEAHPLMMMFNQIKEYGAKIKTISIQPISEENVFQLVSETLESSTSKVKELSKLIYTKTNGNPFFLTQFFKSLYDQSFLNFNPTSAKWEWNNQEIQNQDFTENVIELMSSKIEKLSLNTKSILKIAAAIGMNFNLGLVAQLQNNPLSKIKESLREAIIEGLIIPNQYSEEVVTKYKFLHDRIQQAAYSTLESDELIQLHHRIGIYLSKQIPYQEDVIFDVVNHLNYAISEISTEEEKLQLARWNYQAALKAKSSNAYSASAEYLNTAISLLPENSQDSNYELIHSLYSNGVEVSFLKKDFQQMEEKLAWVKKNSRTLNDKIPSMEIKIQSLAAESKLIEAIEEALLVLNLLGVHLPKKPGKMHVMKDLISAKIALGRKKPDQLLDLPEMTDPLKLAAMRILISTTSSAFLAMPDLFPLIVFSLLKLSLKYGNSKYSSYGYATYGLVLCGALGDMKAGNEFGKLGLAVLNKYDADELKAKIYFVYYAFIYQWQNPLSDAKVKFIEGYKSGLETGDLEYGGWNAFHICSYTFFSGGPLNQTYETILTMKDHGEKLGILQVTLLMDVFIPVIALLSGKTEIKESILSEEFEDELLPVFKELKYTTAMYERLLTLGMAHYYFNEYEKAEQYFDSAEPLIESVVGMEYTSQFYFFAALASTKLKEPKWSKINKYQKKLKKWAKDSPSNYLHKYQLVKAEIFRNKGNFAKAEEMYLSAIANANEQKYLNDEGIACERAFDFYTLQSKEDIALTYLIKSRYSYLKWGADQKVHQIDSGHQQLLRKSIKVSLDLRDKFFDGSKSISLDSSTTDAVGIDLLTVLKASQSISGEIVLENLLEKLLLLIIQNAGAEKGYLILQKNEKLFFSAESEKETGKVKIFESTPLENSGKLAESIVKYVALLKESVILEDASESSLFANDDYIRIHKPKSILCLPFLNQNELRGIIYLENNLSKGVFTEKRLALLKLLTGQIAISLENAQFYDQLEQRVADRTTELTAEKKKSDDLLLNILPPDVANELKETGKSKAKSYERVSVMFTDFKDFTRLSENLSPEELVDKIDYCFRKFDEITTKYQLEKIKTIGDSYLCVSGIPKFHEKSEENIILAALEISEFIELLKSNDAKKKGDDFEVRIGINTGPLIAGIVGMKKFAFDIWGDTVNTAARMEQNSEPGRINISQSTYELVKDKFNCTYRGEIEAKNKGKLKMYFVNKKI